MSVEQRLARLEEQFGKEIARKDAALREARQNAKAAEEERPESGCCWQIIKVLQYIVGFTLSIYSLIITFFGLLNGYSKSSPCTGLQDHYAKMDGKTCVSGPLPAWLVIIFLCLLVTVLAYCEGTQIALMLLEKVNGREIPDDICCSARVKRTHQLAQNNTERYLLGRQIFVTGIVFMVAKMIGMKSIFATAVKDSFGETFGSQTLVLMFVNTGFAGSLIVLAFGQLVPQLIVTTTPLLQYQLFPTYEIIWLQLFCERLGVAEMAPILRKFTKWVYGLKDEDFGVGSGVEFTIKAEEDAEEQEELGCCVTFWMEVPFWQQIIKIVVGVVVFCGSLYFICDNILGGHSDFTIVERDADGKPVVDENLPYPGWKAEIGDVHILIQLLLFFPVSNIIMGFLEGSQIAILALEKAPAAVIKRTHRDAYFGHKLTQQRDNVRRYLLGRQFFVVFVDFIAAHSMGIGGLGILVPVSQLFPQLLAASNPAWFMSTWGSKGVLLLTLIIEFTGLCHFSWGLFTIFFVIRNLVQSEEKANVGSVGQAVDIAGAGVAEVDAVDSDDIGQLQITVAEQQEKIRQLEAQVASRT